MCNKYAIRNQEIIELKKSGMRQVDIANKMNLSRERIRQILKEHFDVYEYRHIRYPKYFDILHQIAFKHGYSESVASRTYNYLEKNDILKNAELNIQDLSSYSDSDLLSIKGFGSKCLELFRLMEKTICEKANIFY